MSPPTRPKRTPGLKFLLVALLAIGATVYIGITMRRGVARCPAGLWPDGPRCCPIGQRYESGEMGACVGQATSCASSQELAQGECQLSNQEPVRIAAGSIVLAPDDWESEGRVEARVTPIAGFRLQKTEVTHAEWDRCEADGKCRRLDSRERFLPVTDIAPQEAERYCKSLGGRLPTSDEWMLAAAGEESRRYPWGPSGLVCRRAAFGLVSGPCAKGASGPELVGSRPDGATTSGLFDLAGNVSEWTRTGNSFGARGGSFEAELAGELKTWSTNGQTEPSRSIGVRCAFDE